MMPGVNHVIYGYFSTTAVWPYGSLTLGENIVAVITEDKVIYDNWKKQIKNRTLCTCRLFLLT